MTDQTDVTDPAKLVHELVLGSVADPFPLYNELREAGTGVHWAGILNGWVIARYDDSRRTLAMPELFSNDTFFDTAPGVHDPEDAEHRRFIGISSKQFMFQDPPVHTQVRSIFRHAFTRQAIERWRPVVESVADTLLSRFNPGQELDIMPSLAADIPVAVIASILGLPEEKWGQLREWSEAFGRTLDPGVQGALRDSSIRISLELMDYLADLIHRRRADPRDDLITLIATTPTLDGDQLSEADVIAQVTLLLAAGNDTTTSFIGSGMTIMIDNPGLKDQLRDSPALIPAAIEEMLRLDPPFHLDFRRALADVEVGGQRIETGQMCFQVLAAANRDPRKYTDPDTFLLGRDEAPHLAFSHGVHFCVGAPLARLEGEVALRKILERFPSFTAGEDPALRRTDNILARGWHQRPVRL
jgi:hypothetical protein